MIVVEPRHGSYATYKNHRCRCEACIEAMRLYQRERYAGKRKKRGRPFQAIKHGTLNAYVKRECRCRECVLNWREYTRVQARRLRGYAKTGVVYSLCPTCNRNFPTGRGVGKDDRECCSQRCYAKKWRDDRRIKKTVPALPHTRGRELLLARQKQEYQALLAANPQLAELAEDQKRDAARIQEQAPWVVSLDAVSDGYRDDLYESLSLDHTIGPDAAWVPPLLHIIDRRREIDHWATEARS